MLVVSSSLAAFGLGSHRRRGQIRRRRLYITSSIVFPKCFLQYPHSWMHFGCITLGGNT